MNNGITFQSILISIMEDFTIVGLSIHAQITNTESFEKQTHGF